MSDGADELLAYRCEGPHHIVTWSRIGRPGPTLVVARSTLRGRPWIRALRKIGRPGWHITAHRRKADAMAPFGGW